MGIGWGGLGWAGLRRAVGLAQKGVEGAARTSRTCWSSMRGEGRNRVGRGGVGFGGGRVGCGRVGAGWGREEAGKGSVGAGWVGQE